MAGVEMDIKRSTNSEGRITRLAVFGVIDGNVDENSLILALNDFLEQGGISQLRRIANAGVQDPDSKNQLARLFELFASYLNNQKSTINENELEGDKSKSSPTFNKYKGNPKLRDDFSNWKKTREDLIEISKSTAERLDQQYFIVNIARIIGSLVEILNELDLGIYEKSCSFIESFAYNISPKLGFITECALQLAPHLRFMGFVSSFYDILESQVAIKRVVNVMENDEDMFEPLKEWLDETNELNEIVKRLLPYKINTEIIKSLDGALVELGEEQKIFSAAILSNIMKDPMIYKDKKFMSDALRFCSSDAAREWYNRMIKGSCPSEQDRDFMNLQEELRKLEGADASVGLAVENSKGMVETVENATKTNKRSDFGRYAIFLMSGMSIYWSLGNIRSGSRHRYSDRLRKLSRKAQSFLHIMERINFENL